MLNENEDDPRHLPVDLLPLIIEATGDMRPILWLVAKFMPDDATRDRVRNARIEQLLSELPSLLADWKANGKRR